MNRVVTGILLLLPVHLLPVSVSAAEASDQFTLSVMPLLQKHCVSCHNDLDKKGEFSLQQKSAAMESGHIVAGQPDESGLLAAVVGQDGRPAAMPKDGQPLSDADVDIIRRWIQDGAEWPDGQKITEPVVTDMDWWSLRPLSRPQIPRLPDHLKSWVRTPVDAFIRQGLQDRQLAPSPEADRRTLIRRVYFDLIGLPPTPEQVAEFVASRDERAWENLVESLLQSPHYGERWARHWLDVARYADTSGYDKDKLRPNAWPYRDYVIRAFNDDKPYARFVQEQVAGDVLFPGTADGILGLGFIAAGPWDWIGHGEVPESKIDGKIARHTDRDEMVSGTLNSFCSVTIQCCQCHNHKFDPLTQEHYYNLQSVFAAVDRAERPYDQDTEVQNLRLALQDEVRQAKDSLKAIDSAVRSEGGAALQMLESRISELTPVSVPVSKSPEFGYHSAISPASDVSKWVELDMGREVEISRVVLRPCHDEFNGIGAGFGFPVRFVVSASLTPASLAPAAEPPVSGKLNSAEAAATVLFDTRAGDFPNPGMLPVELPVAQTGVAGSPEGTGSSDRTVSTDGRISTEGKLRARYVRITANRLAPRMNDFIMALAEVQVFDQSGTNVALKSTVNAADSIEAPVRWAAANLTDGIWAEARDEQAVRQLAELTKERQLILDRLLTEERRQEQRRLQEAVSAAEARLRTLPAGRMVYAAATDFAPQGAFVPTKGQPRSISVLHRGNILQPRSPAVPGTVPILAAGPEWDAAGRFQLPENHREGDRRAALAHWLTDNNNPLTWRSIVNRVWQYHMGRGIVDTPNDFGRMGQLPTHPELLDWLATEFRDNGQSFKSLHRLIVLSSTYRQSSAMNSESAAEDSENRYLWRMNRRRLEAEELRDAMLSVSGKLDTTMGGPGYYLFVLERPEHSPHYEYHKFDPEDPASHRRSIYRFIVRSQPDPWMTTLDCADSSQSTPQRNETLTSLQALSLLNNGFSMSMSKHFAHRVRAEASDSAGQVRAAFLRISGREPEATELAELTAYTERHGLENLCRVLLNLSEFVYLD